MQRNVEEKGQMAVVLVLAEIFTVIMERNVCEKVFDKKQKNILTQIMVWVCFFLISNGCTYFWEFPSWLNMFMFSVLFLGVLAVLYEGLFKIRLVFVVFFCLVGMLSEVIIWFAGIMCGVSAFSMQQDEEVMLVCTILSKLVWFIEIKIALLFLKKNKNVKIRRMDWLEVFAVPLSSIIVVLAMFIPFTDDFTWLKFTASVLVLVINLFTFYNYNELQEKALYHAEKEFLTQQVENYAAQLQEMSRNWQQTKEYRHDMKQKYLLVESWLKQNQYDKIRELYQQDMVIPTEEENFFKTGNISFDTIINYKASVAQKNGIKVKLTAVVPYDFVFDDVDLYSLLGNLFDNAIEAVKQITQNQRIITLTAKVSGENLYIEMENPYEGDLKRRGSTYITMKEDSREHGMGLRIVEDIAKRHDGEIIINDAEHYFNVQVLLYHIGK